MSGLLHPIFPTSNHKQSQVYHKDIVQIENTKVTIWHKGFSGILSNLVNQVWQIKIFDQKIQTCSVNGLKAKNQFYNFVHERRRRLFFRPNLCLSDLSCPWLPKRIQKTQVSFYWLFINICNDLWKCRLCNTSLFYPLHSFRWPISSINVLVQKNS